jgi:hypothetical protein
VKQHTIIAGEHALKTGRSKSHLGRGPSQQPQRACSGLFGPKTTTNSIGIVTLGPSISLARRLCSRYMYGTLACRLSHPLHHPSGLRRRPQNQSHQDSLQTHPHLHPLPAAVMTAHIMMMVRVTMEVLAQPSTSVSTRLIVMTAVCVTSGTSLRPHLYLQDRHLLLHRLRLSAHRLHRLLRSAHHHRVRQRCPRSRPVWQL